MTLTLKQTAVAVAEVAAIAAGMVALAVVLAARVTCRIVKWLLFFSLALLALPFGVVGGLAAIALAILALPFVALFK